MHRFLLVVWVLCIAGIASAQDAEPARSPTTLDQLLKPVVWDVSRNGPLLVVDPQGTPVKPLPGLQTPPAIPGDRSLQSLAPQFSRQILRIGSMNVCAPATMVILNSRPGMADPFAGLLRSQKVRLLMGSLTPDQWRALGSSQGLGVRDLAREQQPLFLSLLPDPFGLNSYKMTGGHRLWQPEKGFTLSPEDRAEVRLRVNRTTEIGLPTGNGGTSYFPDLQDAALPEGAQFFTLAHVNPQPDPSAFGITLRTEVANRLKPGHLAFDAPALQIPIHLNDAKTVQDLMNRIAQATHQELYADGRVTKLPVWTCGSSARAGDLLQSLCLAVTGTMRKVGPAFVLTSDLEGIGTMYARLGDWARDASDQRRAALEAADNAAIPPAASTIYWICSRRSVRLQLGRIGKAHSSRSRSRFLKPVHRSSRVAAAEPGSHHPNVSASRQTPLTGDRAKISLTYKFSYIVPAAGVVNEEDDFHSHISLPTARPAASLPPKSRVTLPPGLATRAVSISPVDGKDISRFALRRGRRD